MAFSIKKVIAPHFYKAHHHIKNDRYSEIWLSGGRGSTKTSFIAVEMILGIMQDPETNGVAFRKTQANLADSVYNNLKWAIEILGVSHLFKCGLSPLQITYLPTGQQIKFRGLDDPEKIKGIKFVTGYPKFLWFEELTEFAGMAEIQNVQQSLERGTNANFITMLSYNPPQSVSNWVNEESKAKNQPDYRYSVHSTYLTVPRDWLGNSFLARAEFNKKYKPEVYQHQYMGIATGINDRLIFNKAWETKEFETPNTNEIYSSRFFYGVDWGFAKDPTTMVRCFIKDNCLYIDHEVGGVGVEFEDLVPLFRSIPQYDRWEIRADNARPETISYVRRQGLNIKGCDKWSGSVEDGIDYIRGFKMVYIHPRCTSTRKEFESYSYKVDEKTLDENGNPKVLPIVNDTQGFDHYIDAIRYALNDYIKKDVSIFDTM